MPAARLIALAAMVVSLPHGVLAQDSIPEQPLVFAASRYAQTPAEAPASVSVITRDEIERFGYRTLGEVLSAAGGIFSSYDRNYTYVTVRGLARQGDFNTRILLMVDGHRVNDAGSDDAYMGTEAIVDVDAIDRVEIIRGPGSSLYGTNAFYAVVNLVTRQGRKLSGLSVRSDAASFDSYHGSAAYGKRFASGLEAMLTTSVYHSEGQSLFYPEFASPLTNNGNAISADGDRYEKALGTLQFGDWRVEGAFSSRRKFVPTGAFGTTFDDPNFRTRDRQAMVSLDYEHPFADLSRIWTTLAYNWFRYDGIYPYGSVISRDYTSADWWTLQTQYLRLLGDGHKLTAGGELRWNMRQDQGAFDVNPPAVYLADRRSSWVWAGFAQGEFRLAPRVSLVAGIRYDHYESFGGTANPRGSLLFKLDPATTLKAMYGRAFRAPNNYELHYEDGGRTQEASPGLRPETIHTFEIAAERQVARDVRATMSLYHVRVQNLIGLTPDTTTGLLAFQNVDRARATGLEAEVAGRLVGRLDGRLSYAYQHVIDASTDAPPVNSPQHLARVGLSLPLLVNRLRGSLEVRYVSSRATRSGVAVSDYALANFTLLAHPFGERGPSLSGSIYNLFDSRYGDPGGDEHIQDAITQDPRSVRLGLRLRF
jgi:outer membrane receptor for ferrienterochelin and colicins